MSIVYILDDNQEFSATLAAMCEVFGHTSRCFSQVDDFIKTMEQTPPHLVLLDMWLGSTTGIDLFKSEGKIFKDIPVVLVSGGGHQIPLEAVTAMGEVSGINDILYKPISAAKLKELFDKTFPSK